MRSSPFGILCRPLRRPRVRAAAKNAAVARNSTAKNAAARSTAVKNAAVKSESPKTPAKSDENSNPPVGIGPGDWGQWGGSSLRNNTPNGTDIPSEWSVGGFDDKTGDWKKDKAKNVKWVARLGSQSYGNPVVANGHAYVGSNNGAGYLKRYPASIDLGVLLCFDETDGKFLWQHSNEKLPTGRVHDWPMQGVCSAPLVEGKRLWYVTNRGEVICLDTEGFHDGVDNGPVQNELGRLFEIVKNEDPAKDKVAGLLDELKQGKIPAYLADEFKAAGLSLPDAPSWRRPRPAIRSRLRARSRRAKPSSARRGPSLWPTRSSGSRTPTRRTSFGSST